MLVLRTGLPGHSKTLNAIKEIDAEASAASRVVYYHNIPDLATDKLSAKWYEFEDPVKWYELPHNSIIVVDEAQTWFGTRDSRQPVPQHLSEFETHRHKGFDVHLITQHGMLLDAHARRIAGKHIYFLRMWNGNRVQRYEFEKFTDTEKTSEKKLARRSIIKIDKKMFGVYKSSVGHHMKFRPPLLVVLTPIFFVLVAVGSYFFMNHFGAFGVDPVVQTQIPESSPVQPVGRALPKPSDLSAFTPRIEGLPSSAPAYDGLTAPAVVPKLTCFYSDDAAYNAAHASRLNVLQGNDSSVACGCFTQQGTKVDTPFHICQAYALNGSFDNTPQGATRSTSMGYRK